MEQRAEELEAVAQAARQQAAEAMARELKRSDELESQTPPASATARSVKPDQPSPEPVKFETEPD
eukprot:4472325-Alexandrium_andersonii.AAC.1